MSTVFLFLQFTVYILDFCCDFLLEKRLCSIIRIYKNNINNYIEDNGNPFKFSGNKFETKK